MYSKRIQLIPQVQKFFIDLIENNMLHAFYMQMLFLKITSAIGVKLKSHSLIRV